VIKTSSNLNNKEVCLKYQYLPVVVSNRNIAAIWYEVFADNMVHQINGDGKGEGKHFFHIIVFIVQQLL